MIIIFTVSLQINFDNEQTKNVFKNCFETNYAYFNEILVNDYVYYY